MIFTQLSKVEEEICSEEVSCYTGSLQPFKDLLQFPEDVNFSALMELLDRNEVIIFDSTIVSPQSNQFQNEDHQGHNHHKSMKVGFIVWERHFTLSSWLSRYWLPRKVVLVDCHWQFVTIIKIGMIILQCGVGGCSQTCIVIITKIIMIINNGIMIMIESW